MEDIESLDNFERALSHMRKELRPLTRISRDEACGCLSAADTAQHNVLLAYTMCSLFYMYLRTQGVDTSEHPVRAELDRIRGYVTRLKQVQGLAKPEQRALRVDVAATRRFIEGALSSDPVWKNATQPQEGARKPEGRQAASPPLPQPASKAKTPPR